MLLHSTISQSPPHSYPISHSQSYPLCNSLSFPSGFRNSRPQSKPLIITNCSSSTPVSKSYGTEKKPRQVVAWEDIYKRISKLGSLEKGSTGVLNQWENEGNKVTQLELCRLVKKLRKYNRFKLALEVYEWMNNRPERFVISASDAAVQLDLISKVHGVSSAEDYFKSLPENLIDNRIYGALLNVYASARMKEKAESLLLEMKEKNYSDHALPYNVMMTLYLKLKDHEKVEALVAEMMQKNINMDSYTYNIWISSCGAQGSVEKMEGAFEKMACDLSISPNWTTYSTMATMYIKLGQIEKAEGCLRKVEGKIIRRDRNPYHFLLSQYGSIGKKKDVKRIWDMYKKVFPYISNMGYHAAIMSFLRMDDIEEAETLYNEWMSVKSTYDPRIGNRLLGWYVTKGFSEKADAFFKEMLEIGKVNSFTWELVAEGHIKEGRASDALSCFEKAISDEALSFWKPKPANISNLYKICDQENNEEGKNALYRVLKEVGVLGNKAYMSNLPFFGDSSAGNEQVKVEESQSDVDEEADVLVNELHAAV